MRASHAPLRNTWATAEHFAVTYGDGVTDADLAAEFAFHRKHGRHRHGARREPTFAFRGTQARRRRRGALRGEAGVRAELDQRRLLLLPPRIPGLPLDADESCVLERAPLRDLARDGGLCVYRHDGFWQCMDTQRDMDALDRIWREGNAPWKV